MNIKQLKLVGLIALFSCIGALTYRTINNNQVTVNNFTTPRWFNSSTFDQENAAGKTLHDATFEISFANTSGEQLTVKNCFEVFTLGEAQIAQQEFARWEWLKSSCTGASWYYRAPKTAATYWDEDKFNFEMLKDFPITAVPFLGGQQFNNHDGYIRDITPEVKLLESGKNSIKVKLDNMVIDYIVLARADFNHDGIQDLFIRMDWYIEDSFGEGSDWVALTKSSANEMPMLLWRK